MIIYWPDLQRVFGALFILSANVTHWIKLANLIMNRDIFLSLIDFSFASLSGEDLTDPKVRELIIRYEKKSLRDLVVICSWTLVAVISLAALSDLMDPSGLPLVAYYPFEIQYSPVFEFVYAHQMLAVLTAAVLNVTLDIFSTNLVILLCCQFRLLKRDISLIQEIALDKHEDISRRLVSIVERHCILKGKCAELSKIYGVTMLGQFLGSILIICISLYQFYRAGDNNLVTSIAGLFTFLWAVLQAFFYCYYGTEIKIEVGWTNNNIHRITVHFCDFQSESVATALIELPWYRFSQKNKKTVLVMIHMGQQPVVLRAAGLMNITLAALMSVSNTDSGHWYLNTMVINYYK